MNLKTVCPTDLTEILRKFFVEVKQRKANIYSKCIRAAIHRHLTCAPLSRNKHLARQRIHIDPPTKCLKRRPSYLRHNAKPEHKSYIQSGDMQKLDRYLMEGQNTDGVWKNAEKLVEFIWFSLCFHFARRDREGWREHLKQKVMTLDAVTYAYVRFSLVY